MADNKEFSLLNYKEIQLETNPLVVVLCQVTFESILSIDEQSELSKFQKNISDKYPIFKGEKIDVHTFDFTKKTLALVPENIWRFLDKDEKWRVTVTKDSLALESFKYISRSDFREKMEFVLNAFQPVFRPKLIKRVGVRYINQLADDAFSKVQALVNEKLFTVYASELLGNLKSNISEAQLSFDKRYLLARWGLLPERSTIDPNILKPLANKSWILDIDTSNSARAEWKNDYILNELKELTVLNYGFFRWATTPKFIEHYKEVKP